MATPNINIQQWVENRRPVAASSCRRLARRRGSAPRTLPGRMVSLPSNEIAIFLYFFPGLFTVCGRRVPCAWKSAARLVKQGMSKNMNFSVVTRPLVAAPGEGARVVAVENFATAIDFCAGK